MIFSFVWLGQSTQRNRIRKIIEPLANVLGSIYFLCVGMVISKDWLLEHAFPVAKLLTCIAGVTSNTFTRNKMIFGW